MILPMFATASVSLLLSNIIGVPTTPLSTIINIRCRSSTLLLYSVLVLMIYAHLIHLWSGAERDERGIKSLVGTEHWLAFRLQMHSTVSCKNP